MKITINGNRLDASGTLSYAEIVLLAVSAQGFPVVTAASSKPGDARTPAQLREERDLIMEEERNKVLEEKMRRQGIWCVLSPEQADHLLTREDKAEIDEIVERIVQKRTDRRAGISTRNVLPNESVRLAQDREWEFTVDFGIRE